MALVVDRNDLSLAYERQSNGLIVSAGELARNRFIGLGDWRDDDKELFIAQMVEDLGPIKKEASELAVGYHSVISQFSGQNFTPPVLNAAEFTTSALRNGVADNTVYARPFTEMRTALAKGLSVTESVELGARRAQSLAQTEIQLARRQASLFARRANDNIVGYLRVLSGSENCALCYVASTQRYRKGDLLPIHPGCDCGEMPIYGDTEVGQVIDQQRLDAAHEQVEQRLGVSDTGGRAPDYRKITTYEHGELGPTLAVRSNKNTGPTALDLTGKKTKKLIPSPVDLFKPDKFSLGLTTQLKKLDDTPLAVASVSNPRAGRPGGAGNCTNCVTAFDMRSRGYDVIARGEDFGRDTQEILRRGYRYNETARANDIAVFGRVAADRDVPDVRGTRAVLATRITDDIIENNPVGSYGFISGQWKRGSSGHVWVWRRTEDGVEFLDPQKPNGVARDYLKQVNGISTSYVRVDDLDVIGGVKEFVENASEFRPN